MNSIWIRSQDKRDLVLAKAISVDPAIEHVTDINGRPITDCADPGLIDLEGVYYLVATEADNYTFILGEFRDEESAMRVLDAIHMFAASGTDGVFPVPEADDAE